MKIFLVIPLHNEQKHIGIVLKELLKQKLQLVVIDDGSTDSSCEVVENFHSKKIVLLRHKVNLGKGAAMKTGAEYSFSNGVDAIIFLDADGQHSPKDIYKFLKVLSIKKYDFIVGSRTGSVGMPLVRYLGNKIASVVINLFFGVYVSDALCGFRAVTKNGYKKIKWDSAGYGVETEVLARVGINKVSFCEIPVETIYHDATKGVTLLDAFGVLGEVVKWRATL